MSEGGIKSETLEEKLDRLIELISRAVPSPSVPFDPEGADAFSWSADESRLRPVEKVNCIPLELLKGIDSIRDRLLENTRRFASGAAANNALLWGARGMGKSSLVKSIHASVVEESAKPSSGSRLKLIEIHREDIASLPSLLRLLQGRRERFILFCDDLSFEADDLLGKSLKAILDGGVEGRPENVVFYATSNRRHLVAREMIENERSTAIIASEAVEEKVSLSDRFGLWLGFHGCGQDEYLAMVEAYAEHYGLSGASERLQAEALEWAAGRGGRSGRVAWQYALELAGRLGKALE